MQYNKISYCCLKGERDLEKFIAVFKKPLCLVSLSALLAALPFTFPSLFLLSWVAFCPFFYVILQKAGEGKWLSALGRGAWFGFLYHFFIYWWFLRLYPLDFAGLEEGTAFFVVMLAWFGISFLSLFVKTICF